MNRKTLTRIAFASVAVPALAFGAPATAMADSFFSGESSAAGIEGAASHNVTAVAFDGNGGGHGHKGDKGHDHWDNGGSFYKKSATWAGHDGAASHSIVSGAN
ncbi:hypothetical protein [Nocardiopsis sp. HUAS JQ3]|uniref:hypothetical protein n=1 Tax=Nocardiopsis sp. HUAS JQ3 TaxID=3061629 RepID=UPI0023A9E603|nr:hypothetical protein [Nocardiopsis sp. HUAS JQ3]WDZ88696.1 hypothetical protein PV789_17160 [Nocardiopsis sp. HUAS JQ3]